MTSAPSTYYDALIEDPANAYLHATGGPYEDLYRRAASMIPKTVGVCDLGCGTGRFARILFDGGYSGPYVGVDFAGNLLAEARRHVPEGVFELADLRDWDVIPADIYVALELLEHLDDDRGLLARLPSGANIILSVPSFESFSHVRTFPAEGQARERYASHVTVESEQTVTLPSGAYFHLLSGLIR